MGVDLPLFIQTHFLALFIKPSCGATLWSLVTSGGEVRFGIAGRAFFVWVTWYFDTLALLTLLKWADLPPIWGYLEPNGFSGEFWLKMWKFLENSLGHDCHDPGFCRFVWSWTAGLGLGQGLESCFGMFWWTPKNLYWKWFALLADSVASQTPLFQAAIVKQAAKILRIHLGERPGNGCRSQAMHRCETKDTIHLEHWQK